MMYDSAFIKDHVIKPKTWSPKKDAVGEHISYIDLSSVDKEDKTLVYSLIQNIDASEAPSRAKQLVNKDDIIVSTVRPNLNGVAIVSRELFNATASTAYCVLRTAESLHNKYLFYWVRSKSFINDMIRKSKGATYPAVSDKIIKDSKIPLPPLDQQKKIAAILDAADAYRQKTKALIEKYDELTRSLFLDMFGDPVTNPKGWDMKTLVDIVSSEQYSLKRGPFGGSLKKEIFKQTGYKVYEQKNAIKKNVNDGRYFIDEIKYNEMKAFNVNPGDFIVSCSGTIGEIFQIPVGAPEGIINQALMKIKINEELLLPNFFESLFTYYIKDNIFISGSKGSGLKNVSSMKIIKAERFIVPSIEYQKKFVDLKLNLKKQKTQAQASFAQAEDLFNSLLQRAFKGELT